MATPPNRRLIAVAWILVLARRTIPSRAFSPPSSSWGGRTAGRRRPPQHRPAAGTGVGGGEWPSSPSSSPSSSSSSSSTSTTTTTTEGGTAAAVDAAAVDVDVGGAGPEEEDDDYVPEMPWSDAQEAALRDSLPGYTFFAPSSSAKTTTRTRRHARWWTMSREVPELAGYPAAFLRRMHRRRGRLRRSSSSSSSSSGTRCDGFGRAGGSAIDALVDRDHDDDDRTTTTPGMLPMIDEFEFHPDGGIVGRVYGLPGVADGARVRTPSLVRAERTVPLGYVTTARSWDPGCDDDEDDDGDGDGDGDGGGDGVGQSYELGTMMTTSSSSFAAHRPDGIARGGAAANAGSTSSGAGLATADAPSSSSSLPTTIADFVVGVAAGTGSGPLVADDAESNRDLAYLGGATALLLAGASAVGALGHHLTVNVFWV
ncbi:hypothetical protein ACHAW5_006644 [Stephanodiscus triporus]|uniref:Uncharacterized protein n=1 Tax=Stephanodiscus triporus TaxID=2934178 RepID=A0ABD3N6Z1_9STRA